ncbi:unnamed protein product [Acanthoscelides obtectus]|uniref:RRM domain-containing protein n=1 Tax=Acanthoscelides obtectus TaxID=200917 RepID=A0A9P0PYY8_ACAOB|nr:unnamed protein product [Acanthoscelides obtectus]CAK1651569.1 Protein painting of fourth [Acanthoscelides obtectus]
MINRPPPMSQVPNLQLHSRSQERYQSYTGRIGSSEVTNHLRRPQSSAFSSGSAQGTQRSSQYSNTTRTSEVQQNNDTVLLPHTVTNRLDINSGGPFLKPLPAAMPASRQPPIPPGPPPSSPPPPPPPGAPPDTEKQLLTSPYDVRRQVQTSPYEANMQAHISAHDYKVQLMTNRGPPPEVKKQLQTPPPDLKQQMQTPPPQFVTPPGATFYAPTPPFYLAVGSFTNVAAFSVPPPPIGTPRSVPGTILQGSPSNSYYAQGSLCSNPQNSFYNYHKRSRVSDSQDPDLRRGSKKKKKSLAQILPQRRGWSMEDAKKAIEIERECNRKARRFSLFIKFPDAELNREIVSSFHSAIESVHFQQPSTPRFCFVNISSSADPEAVRQELNKVQFGGGYLTAEFKKDREEDVNVSPENMDPTTLYVGNLAQEVTKDDMLRMYPKNKRIDIGYAKRIKFTRYAFVVFNTAADAMEAYKKTHDRQMYNKSLIVRFRRLNGNIGMLGEPKVQSKAGTEQSQSKDSETSEMPSEENDTADHYPWDIDVSSWELKYNERCYLDEDDDCDDVSLDVKPSLEELERDFQPPMQHIQTRLLSGPLDMDDLPRPIIETKKEGDTEVGAEVHRNSNSQQQPSATLPLAELSDSEDTSRNSEATVSDLNNTVTVKAEVKTEICGNDIAARSTYRQLMLTRRRKNITVEVKQEQSDSVESETGKNESVKEYQQENGRLSQVQSQNESSESKIRFPDKNDRQALLETPSATTDDKRPSESESSREVCGEIQRDIEEQIPDLTSKRYTSTLRQIDKNINIAPEVEQGNENDDVGDMLGSSYTVDRNISTEMRMQTVIIDQPSEEENLRPASREENLPGMVHSSQKGSTECSNTVLKPDNGMVVSVSENEANKQMNDDSSFDVDLDILDNIKRETRAADDFDDDADFNEDNNDDDEFLRFLKHRKPWT